jgi:RNA polymerase sigma-70 factor (sigma-E family)
MEPSGGMRRPEDVQSAVEALPAAVSSERSLEELYVEEAPRALRLAYLLTGDRSLAEDLVHDAFVRVAARHRALRDPEAFGAYLRRAVVNRTHSYFRHQRVVRDHLRRQEAAPAAVSHEAAVDRRDTLWQALTQLPPRQRAALVCRYYLDLSERETAGVLGCRPGTVKSAVSRGLAALRAIVEPESEGS